MVSHSQRLRLGSTVMLIAAALLFALPPLPHDHDTDGPLARTVALDSCRDPVHPVPHISGARNVAPPICLACVIGTRPATRFTPPETPAVSRIALVPPAAPPVVAVPSVVTRHDARGPPSSIHA